MPRRLWPGAALFGLLAILSTRAPAQLNRRPMQGKLKVNDPAPEFTVKDVEDKETTKLADLKGKPVVLIFGSCT